MILACATPPVRGAQTRLLATWVLMRVLVGGRTLRDVLNDNRCQNVLNTLDPTDVGFFRALVGYSFRYLGPLSALVRPWVTRPPKRMAALIESVLLIALCQAIALRKVPAHAVGACALATLDVMGVDTKAKGFVNALIRRVFREGVGVSQLPWDVWFPRALSDRWRKMYGEDRCRAARDLLATPPPLDVAVSGDPRFWAKKLDAKALIGQTVRLSSGGAVTGYSGFSTGDWWVQDVAAGLAVTLLGSIRGAVVADLCAAPGGKTAQACSAGALVTAVDVSAGRCAVMRSNLKRLGYSARIEERSAEQFCSDPKNRGAFDSVLLDAPCSASGTFRHNPDVLWRGIWRSDWRSWSEVIGTIAKKQSNLLDQASRIVKPGGVLTYCVCSLEPEEGEGHCPPGDTRQSRARGLRAEVIQKNSVPVPFSAGCLDNGGLRVHPSLLAEDGGCDGFYFQRYRRLTD